MEEAESTRELHPEIAALLATLVAHQEAERAARIIRPAKRDTSNWKWYGRWERIRC